MPNVVLCALLTLCSTSSALAQADAAAPSEPAGDAPVGAPEAKPTEGILPVPDYSGDLLTRRYLTGDWWGHRTALAEKGVQFNMSFTQEVQSVVKGGLDTGARYNGALDYSLSLDLMRMQIIPGALVQLKAETRFGRSVNASSGAVLPVNADAFFPITQPADEDIPITITTLSYTQFLAPTFGLMVGKFDTLDGDSNEFASGRGKTQFMNANFLFNAATALRMPYSTLGGGLIWMPIPDGPGGGITLSSLVFATTDSSTTSGFGTMDDGLTWTTQVDFKYRLGDLPGGMNVGALYSFDQDFARIGSRFVFERGNGLSLPTEDETWAVYWSGWQYLWVQEPSDRPIDLRDGLADRVGVGLFARAGLADSDTNPAEWAVSVGVGGRGVFDRADDTYGVGYFYTRLQNVLFRSPLEIEDHSQGVEAYYNCAITPAARFTFDLQVISSPLTEVDTAVILGGRLNFDF